MTKAVSQPARRAERSSPPLVAAGQRRQWERRYAVALRVLDVTAATGGMLIARLAVARPPEAALWTDDATAGALVGGIALVTTWVAMMSLADAYDVRHLSAGSEEYKRVASGALWVFALVAVVVFAFSLDVDPEFVALFVLVATALELGARRVVRKRVHELRARGRWAQRVLVVGAEYEVVELVTHLRRAPYTGLLVVAACLPERARSSELAAAGVALVIGAHDVIGAVASVNADTIIVADSHTLAGDALRELAWELAGTGIDLIVAPAVTEVAGPRISVRPVAGLPLLHVEEPELTGGQRLFKELFDRFTAAFLLLALAPALLAIAGLVRIGSRGPALFRQVRVGRGGRLFAMLKFRTMVDGAEEQLDALQERNDHDGILFKLREDPRVTRVGRFLRRHSLDELPQLWNVLRGDMSVVGPRPPLPSEVARYGTAAHRRLFVKPGLTGLWQVSGRSELSFEESIHLDLFYVENWSPALDAQIIWRTIPAVIRGPGAY